MPNRATATVRGSRPSHTRRTGRLLVDHTDDLTRHEQSARIRQGSRVGAPRLSQHARRLCLALTTFLITVVLFGAVGVGLLSLRLSHGPITVAALNGPVLSALSSHLKPGFKVDIEGVDVEDVDGRPAITLKQMSVRDDAGRPILRAPRATVSVDPLRLLGGGTGVRWFSFVCGCGIGASAKLGPAAGGTVCRRHG